jgi:alpha-ketoglutarate-dependent taurine dioxygenase
LTPAERAREDIMALTVRELTPRIGSEVLADAATLLGGAHASEIRALLDRRGVLVFREIGLDDAQQVAFTKTLGELQPMGPMEVFQVTLDTGAHAMAKYLESTFDWHIDATNQDVPPLASLLSARQLASRGGQTEFANTYAAWEALPEAERRSLDGLRVLHSLETAQRLITPEPTEAQIADWRRVPPKTHPLVWTHRSGRKSLVLGATASHVEGMDLADGRALLDRLLAWATRPEFVYRHDWRLGDLVIWDNTGTMHRAIPYAADSGRRMHRTSLAGEEAFA